MADALARDGSAEVAAYFVDAGVPGVPEELDGRPVLREESDLDRLLRSGVRDAIVGIGDNRVRLACSVRLETRGFSLVHVVHPSAVASRSARIGPGTFLAAGAIVNPGAVVGRDVILNTSSSVDHDCVVGDAVHLSPGVRLSGRVRIGRLAWLGTGAVVKDGITIGTGSVVGAGSVVVRDVPPEVVVYGNPARVRRVPEAEGDE